MGYTPYQITEYKTGLDVDDDPAIAPGDSFSILNNAHVHHKRIEKRKGSLFQGYMVHNPNGATYPSVTNISQANPGIVTLSSMAGIVNGDYVVFYSVGGMTEVNNIVYQVSGIAGLNFNLQTVGSVNVNTTGFSPYTLGGVMMLIPQTNNRIMGIAGYIAQNNARETLIFDMTRAAIYNGPSQHYDPLDTADIFSSTETDFVWYENWQSSLQNNRMYFTNGKVLTGGLNGIRYYDQVASSTTTTLFRPSINNAGTIFLDGCKLIFAIKGRLVVLHTFEDGRTFPQRARWCAFESPSNWVDDVPGGGGFVDAPTGDQIISARALKDKIIVFFTESVWTLVKVSDPALPFAWQKLNNYRSCDGKMATIGYDRFVIAMGSRGITATDGIETKRVDDRIQDFTNETLNAERFNQVFAERSYTENRYWTLFPSTESEENNSALIYDDESESYSTYSVAYTALGHGTFERDLAIEDFTLANNLDITISEGGDNTIQDYVFQKNSEAFLGGTVDGKIFVLETDTTDTGTGIPVTLQTAAWNPFQETGTECQLGYIDFYVDSDTNSNVQVEFFKDQMTNPYATQYFTCLPNLGFISTIIGINLLNPVQLNCPNHGMTTGQKVYIYGIEGTVQIDGGPYTVTVVNEDFITLDGIDGSSFGTYTGGGTVNARQYYHDRIWKRVFVGGYGFQHWLRITTTGEKSPFRLHKTKAYFRPRGRRTIN